MCVLMSAPTRTISRNIRRVTGRAPGAISVGNAKSLSDISAVLRLLYRKNLRPCRAHVLKYLQFSAFIVQLILVDYILRAIQAYPQQPDRRTADGKKALFKTVSGILSKHREAWS